MRRIASVFSVLAVALAAACSTDRSTSSPLPLVGSEVQPRANGLLSTPCPTLTPQQITDLIFEVFETGSPDANSARGKWDNIQKQKADGNTTEVENKTYDLIDFMMDKQREGKLATSPEVAAKFSQLLKALACFAGIEFEFPVGSTGDYLDPSDPDRLIKSLDNQAAGFIPAGAVNARALFVITRITEELRTPLDKYPVNYDFSLYPNAGFNQLITLGICATAPDIGTLSRLVLGHNIGASGFEILSPRNVDFMQLQCQPAQTAQNTVVDRVLSALLPKKLYAAAFFGVGGVGGAASELSPFGPVDPRIRVTKLTTGTSAPIGGTISPAPSVRYSTANGTALGDITTLFSTNSGTITPSSVTSEGTSGIASATSWTLGTTPGEVTATATPQLGGPVAVSNAYFVNENWEPITSVTFSATATAPTKLVVTQAPANGTSFVAGVSHTPATIVQAQDEFDRVVPAYTGTISVSAAAGTTPQALLNPASKSAVGGEATFSNLAITKAGTFTLTPSASYNGNALPVTGTYSVNIVAAAGIISRAAPLILDTVTIGTQTPRVRVVDAYGNPVVGSTVYWKAVGSSVTPTSTVDAGGFSSATWALQEGPNSLLAALDNVDPVADGRSIDFATFYKVKSTALMSCSVNQNRADVAPHGFRLGSWPKVGPNFARLDTVKFFFSVTGEASSPKLNKLRLIATRKQSSTIVRVDTIYGDVLLKGNASQDAPGVFIFPANYTTTTDQSLELKIERVDVATQGTLRFNTGSCSGANRLIPYRFDGTKGVTSVAYQLMGR